MAQITYFPGNADVLPPDQTFDITSIVAKRVGPYLNYYSFGSDGTMFVLHAKGVADATGTLVPTIVGWEVFNGVDVIQFATTNLPLQPLLTNMDSRNPSSTRAVNWLMGGDDSLTGSDLRDNMRGLGGNDSLSGGLGHDTLAGGTGNDLLDGGAGRDRLMGQAGDDVLIGGLGKDALTGGTGADDFVFRSLAEGGDTIIDFHSGEDQLHLSATGFGLSQPLTEGVNFIAAAGANATYATTTLLYDSATGVLSFDADGTGSGAATLLATFSGMPLLTVGDLLLI